MEEFTLEEWEWPPGVERRYIVEPFQSKCLTIFGLTQITLCAIPHKGESDPLSDEPNPEEFLIFMRPDCWDKDTDLAWFGGKPLSTVNYTLREQWRLFPLNLANFGSPLTADSLEKFFVRSFPRPKFAPWRFYDTRYFSLPEGVFLLNTEVGLWYQGSSFRIPADLYYQSSAFVHEWLRGQLAEPDSEIRFAQQWSQQSDEEIDEALIDLAPHLAEWSRITQMAFIVEAPRDDPRFYWRLSAQTEDQPFQSHLFYDNKEANNTHSILNARLQLWGEILQRSFPLSLVNENHIPHCMLMEYRSFNCFGVRSLETVSHHQQMEALMFLRDWAHDKATPEEMGILFPPE